jgi:hypothetical protein
VRLEAFLDWKEPSMYENATGGLVATYRTMEEVEAALRTLADEGIPVDNMSIITQNLESTTNVHGFVSTADVAKSGAGWGAWLGGIFGLLTGVAFLIVPGVGPVLAAGSAATWLVATLEGAGGGAAVGGIIGGFFGRFVSKKHIPKYEQKLKAGKYLLMTHGDSDLLDRAHKLLSDSGAEEIDRHEP